VTDHPEVHGVVRLEDQGSAALRQIAQEIHKVSAAAAHAHHEIAHVHEEGVLSALREHTKEVGESFSQLGESVAHVHEGISDLLPAFAALGAAGSIAGVFELVAGQAEKMEALEHTAAIIGITTKELQRMHYAAAQTGTSTEAMDRGLERLNKNLAAAAHGQNKLVAAALAHAHIKLYDDNGKLKTAADILPEFSDALRRTGNEAVRAQNAMLFMGRAGQELLPMLTMSKEKQHELTEEFEKFHPMGEAGAHALSEYAESLKRVQGAADGFKESMAAEMAPILLPLQDQLADFLAEQSKLASEHKGIGGVLEAEGKRLKGFLESVDWNKVGADIEGVGHAVNEVAEAFGGWGNAAEAVAILMAARGGLFLVAPVIAFAGAIGKVGKAVLELSGAWGAVEAKAGAAAAAEAAAEVAGGGGAFAAIGRFWSGASKDGVAAAELAAGSGGAEARALAAASRDAAAQRAGIGGGFMGIQLATAAFEAQQGYQVSQDDVYGGTGPKFGGHGVRWSEFNTLPKHRGLNAVVANHFGEDFAENGLRSLIPDWAHIFKSGGGEEEPFKAQDFYSPIDQQHGKNPFADPIFAHNEHPGTAAGAPAPPAEARLTGDLTIRVETAGLPPGTSASVAARNLPPGVRADVGHYGNEH
jgi:hypothetical protein